jgi:hypothetical protein
MFCAPGPVFDSTEGVGSRFRQYRRRRVQFSCFALPDSFKAVPRALGPILGGTNGVRSSFHVSRSRAYFRPYRRRRALFSCFALQDSFSAVPRASCPVFMFCAPRPVFGGTNASRPVYTFCAPGLVFGGTDGVRSSFHVLRSRTRFRRYRRRRVPIPCFALLDLFLAVPRTSCPIFIFCALGPLFGGTYGVRSSFHVLRSRTSFRRYRRRRVPFSCFALLDSFLAVPRASRPIFMFCARGPPFYGTDGVGSHFNVLRSRTHFRRY